MNEAQKALHQQAKDHFKIADDWWADNLKAAIDDIKFLVPGKGNQWPEKIRKEREAKGLPCLEVDKISQYLRQVVNDGRQNRPAVRVSPEEDGDVDVAEAFAGLIRAICDRSNADEALDTALGHAAACGFGFFRVITDYVGEGTFNQEILVRRVRNPLAVRLSPHYLADGSDTDYGFFLDDVPLERYKKQWPKAKPVNWKDADFEGGWATEHTVRVCEYFYKVQETKNFLLLEDGTTVSEEDYWRTDEGLAAVQRQPFTESRPLTTTRVEWCRFSGNDVLEENKWLGKYIPIIPVYGNETDVEGKVIYSGLIRPAKDAQRLYNFSRSAFAQRVAMTPKAPWLIAEGQTEGHEDEWKQANTGNLQALVYKETSVEGHPVPPPSRISPTDVPAGFAQDMAFADQDIQAALGMYNASLGQESNEKSGRAIIARDRQSDVGTFHYHDNQGRAIRLLGRVLVDLAPKIIDSKRAARILGEDGKSQVVTIDPAQEKPMTKMGSKTIYNLNAGTYDVSISSGPSYTTKRQESADAMMEMTRANPAFWNTHGDLIAKAQDWPDADQFAKRSKLILPPEIREALDAEEEHSDSPEVVEITQRANQMLQEKDAQIQAAEQGIAERDEALQKLEAENARLKELASLKAAEVEVKRYEAETERMQVLAPATPPEMVRGIVVQTVQEIMAQPAPGGPPMQPPDPPPIAAPIEDEPPPGGFFPPEGA